MSPIGGLYNERSVSMLSKDAAINYQDIFIKKMISKFDVLDEY